MNTINNTEEPEVAFEMELERERQLFEQNQTEKQNSKYNEFNDADALVINSHYQDDIKRYHRIIGRMLTSCDFVNSGSYSAKYSTTIKKGIFTNALFFEILESMVEDGKIKVKQFPNKRKYYYTRLSETEVDNMSEAIIIKKLWQNKD